MRGKEILLISSGPKLSEYKQEIESYINKKKPIVIALNTFTKIKKRVNRFLFVMQPIKVNCRRKTI